MFIPIQKILPQTINKFGVRIEIEAAIICEKYKKLAPRLIHTNALKHTCPKYYRGRTLTVGVENSAWAEQVITNKDRMLDEINKALGREVVLELKTKVEDAPQKPSS